MIAMLDLIRQNTGIITVIVLLVGILIVIVLLVGILRRLERIDKNLNIIRKPIADELFLSLERLDKNMEIIRMIADELLPRRPN